MKKVEKCLTCGVHPREEGSRYCVECQAYIESLKVPHKSPLLYIVYQEQVVEVYRASEGKYYGQLSKRRAEDIGKSKVCDLEAKGDKRFKPKVMRELRELAERVCQPKAEMIVSKKKKKKRKRRKE